MITGVDVSKWQGTIDWSNFHLDFAMIKVSEGVGFVDPSFSRNNSEVVKRGIPHGFYHYVYGSGNTPEEEANFFLDTLKQLDPGEVLAIDFEEPSKVANPVDYVRRMAQVMMDRVGVKPLIYLNSSLCNGYDWTPVVNLGCGLWIANYGSDTGSPQGEPSFSHWPFYAMWQYTSVGRADGISATVDLNQFFGTVEQFKKYGYQAPVSTTTTTTTTLMPSTTTTTTTLPQTTTTTTTVVPTPPTLYDWFMNIWQIIVAFLKQYKKG